MMVPVAPSSEISSSSDAIASLAIGHDCQSDFDKEVDMIL